MSVIKNYQLEDYRREKRRREVEKLSKEKLIKEIADLDNRLNDFKSSKRRANTALLISLGTLLYLILKDLLPLLTAKYL